MDSDHRIRSFLTRGQKRARKKRNQTHATTTPILIGKGKEKALKRTLEFAACLLDRPEVSIIDANSLIRIIFHILGYI